MQAEQRRLGQGQHEGLSANALKTIAAVTMFIDHGTVTFLERTISPRTGEIMALSSDFWYGLDLVGRSIGRQAFPIFAFFIVEGLYHTGSRGKYAFRLFLFTLISQIPYYLMCFTGPVGSTKDVGLNVDATLTLGFLAIWILDTVLSPWNDPRKRRHDISLREKIIRGAGCVAVVLGFSLAAYVLNTDYDAIGVIAIVLFYLFRPYRKMAVLVVWVFLGLCSSSEWLAFPGLLLLLLYNGKKTNQTMAEKKGWQKYAFYWFYPVHMLILWALRVLIFRY